MPNGSEYLTSLLSPGGLAITNHAISAFRLQPLHHFHLQGINEGDGAGSYFKACISIADSFAGLSRGLASWAVVKLYYSTFYCAKARLHFSDECHVYFNYTPYSLECRVGAAFARGKGTSHDYVFQRFVDRFPRTTSLSQQIDLEPPFRWLKRLREEIQYRSTSFGDLNIESVLRRFDVTAAAGTIREYLGRNGSLYAFDPDHAAIAFPLYFFAETSREFAASNRQVIDTDQMRFFEYRCRVMQERIGSVVDLARPLAF